MPNKFLAGLTAALMLSSMAPIGAANATDLVVFHGWSSPAEVAAVNVLRKHLAEKGVNWVDMAIPHDTTSVSLTNLVIGGNPPNAFNEDNAGTYRELYAQGKILDLTDFYQQNDILKNLPPAVATEINVDGKYMKLPVALQIDGMVYYNIAVAKKVGVDPTAWKNLDDMFADFDKIKAAGVLPIAIGAQDWQIGYLLHSLVASVAGGKLYHGLYDEKPDPSVIDSPEMRQVLEYLRKFQQAADPGSVNRDWNVTTNMVITGQALMQIHGDWMKGEWTAAGKKAGVDFGCIPIPGEKGLAVTVDNFGLLGGVDDATKQAELTFASVIMDPAVQAEFAALKGSTPMRTDTPTDKIDECSANVLKALQNPDTQFPTPHLTTDSDWNDSIWSIAFQYWSDPTMTVDSAISQLKEGYDTVFG